jgi:glutathione S-transferase
MRLYGSTRSPFTRKVLVAVHELGLTERIPLEPVVVTTTRLCDEVAAVNPLGQIPTLMLDDGSSLYDSGVICEYLDVLVGGHRLLPAEGSARWNTLNRHALGHGLLDALVKLFTERRRTDALQPDMVEAFRGKFLRARPVLDAQFRLRPEGRFDLGDIAVAGALAYVDFRHPWLEWRSEHPALAAFYAEASERPSMRAVLLEGESPSVVPARG